MEPLPVEYPRMFSVPVMGWATDGWMFSRTVEKAVRKHRPIDLIDAHFVYPDGVGAWLAGQRLGIPVALTVRGKIVRMSRRAIQRSQIRAMLRGVDARIAVSHSLASWVRDVAGSDLDVEVIPNGIDAATFHLVARDRALEFLGWDPNARYLLAVGHMTHHKGFDRVLEMMPAVRRACGDVRLVLAGSDRGESGFKRRLARLIEECGPVEITGAVDPQTLNLMYNAADVLVSASRSEGWCNAISEALATGTPVVATDVGGNCQQICSSELGLTIPDGDADALKEAVIGALRKQWNHILIAAHGSARTWQHVADQVQRVFERVVSNHIVRRRDANQMKLATVAAMEVPS
jgi:glycosyltransferase involved in cell wall biosynthesis